MSAPESAGSRYSLHPDLRKHRTLLRDFYRARNPDRLEMSGPRFISEQLLNNLIEHFKTTEAMNRALLDKYGVDLTSFDLPHNNEG